MSTTARIKNNLVDEMEDEDYVVYLGDNVPIVIKPTERKTKPTNQLSSAKSTGKFRICVV